MLFYWKVLMLAVGLGADAMSVSASVGVRWHGPRQKFRLAWHMGLFQFMMPMIGWFAGRAVAEFVSSWGAWIAAGLVILIGLKMLKDALGDDDDEESKPADPTKGWSLVVLSVATSLDALVAGISLGLQDMSECPSMWLVSGIIGVVACAMSLLGVILGKKIGTKIGKPAEIAGAIVLILLGITFVVL